MPRGRLPKPPGTRAGHGDGRRAEAGRLAILPVDAYRDVPPPPLPPHPLGEKWHPLVLKMWDDVFHSPMASQYLEADHHGIFRMAVLTQAFLKQPSAGLSSEIRALSSLYGLSPLDRRRLTFVIVKTDEAAEAAERRRARSAGRVIEPDPRDILQGKG